MVSFKDIFERKKNYIQVLAKTLPVVLAADSRNSRLEADHLADDGTSNVFSGTKSSTSEIPTCFVIVERPGRGRWPVAIASLENEGSGASTTNNPGTPDDDTPGRKSKPPEVGTENQPDLTSW
jgi:hypothetical protein